MKQSITKDMSLFLISSFALQPAPSKAQMVVWLVRGNSVGDHKEEQQSSFNKTATHGDLPSSLSGLRSLSDFCLPEIPHL